MERKTLEQFQDEVSRKRHSGHTFESLKTFFRSQGNTDQHLCSVLIIEKKALELHSAQEKAFLEARRKQDEFYAKEVVFYNERIKTLNDAWEKSQARIQELESSQAVVTDEEISFHACQRLRQMYFNDAEMGNPALDDNFVIERYKDEWALMMDQSIWMRSKLLPPSPKQ